MSFVGIRTAAPLTRKFQIYESQIIRKTILPSAHSMMIHPQGLTTTALLAILLQSVKPALTQSSLPAAPTAIPAKYATEHPSIYQEYNFTYPEYLTGEPIVASYKDTINVSWTSIAPSDSPSLTIRCWIRNATTSPICTHLHPLSACTY